MRTSTRAAVIIVLIAFAAFAVSAQSPSKVLKQAEKALGGRTASQTFKSVSRSGSVFRTSDQQAGRYVMKTLQPNLFYERFEFGSTETEVAFNGRSGWSLYRNGVEKYDPETVTGKVSSDMKAAAIYHNNLWFTFKAEKASISSNGQSVVIGKSVNVITLLFPKGSAIKMYFDVTSGLLLRDEVPEGDNMEVTEYGDYRNIDGVMRPFYERLTSEGETYEIHFESIKTNADVTRSEFDFPRISSQPLPDIPALLKDLQANEDKVEILLDHYAFTQRTIIRELADNGALREKESETHQLSFYKGFRISRLVEKNGKPLTEKEQADADKDAGKQVDEIEKRIAKNESHQGKLDASGKPSENSRRISIAEVLRASKLINPRRERFRGRDCVVFDFEPDPNLDTRNAQSLVRFFGKTAGVMWIDTQDKQVARLEAALLDSVKFGGGLLANFKKGATFTLEKERVGGEIWLPSQVDINFSARVMLFKGIELNQVQKFYDYKRFETEVKDAKVGEDKTP